MQVNLLSFIALPTSQIWETTWLEGRKFIEGEYANNNVMIYVDGDKNDRNFSTTITFGVEVTGNNVLIGDIVAFDDFKIQLLRCEPDHLR